MFDYIHYRQLGPAGCTTQSSASFIYMNVFNVWHDEFEDYI